MDEQAHPHRPIKLQAGTERHHFVCHFVHGIVFVYVILCVTTLLRYLQRTNLHGHHEFMIHPTTNQPALPGQHPAIQVGGGGSYVLFPSHTPPWSSITSQPQRLLPSRLCHAHKHQLPAQLRLSSPVLACVYNAIMVGWQQSAPGSALDIYHIIQRQLASASAEGCAAAQTVNGRNRSSNRWLLLPHTAPDPYSLASCP